MTNEQIIYEHALELVEEGKIREIDGMPEAIHTFQHWKTLGYAVKKGEKAIAQFMVWKMTTKKKKDDEEQDENRMFLHKASFFSFEQVTPITK